MTILFALFIFLGIIFGAIHSNTFAKSLPESQSTDTNFNLSCMLFGETGCNLECVITARFYSYGSHGECIGRNRLICYCHNHNAYSGSNPYRIWKTKFDSDYVYNRIMENRSTAEETFKILGNPTANGEELKELLKPILSPYQYKKLILSDQSPAGEYIKKGKVDQQSVQKFISKELDTFFKSPMKRSSSQSLLTIDYQNRLSYFLRYVPDKGTLYNFAYKIARLENRALENILDKFLKKSNIEKPQVEVGEEPLVMETLHYLTINEFIKRNDAAKQKN